MPDHIFCAVNCDKILAIVHEKSQTYHFWKNRGITRPSFDLAFGARLNLVDFLQKFQTQKIAVFYL